MMMSSSQPAPEQLKGSIRRQFGYVLDEVLSQEELEFLGQNGDVVFKVFHVLVGGMSDLCPSCIELMGLMTEKDELDDGEIQHYTGTCECGQAGHIISSDEEAPSL